MALNPMAEAARAGILAHLKTLESKADPIATATQLQPLAALVHPGSEDGLHVALDVIESLAAEGRISGQQAATFYIATLARALGQDPTALKNAVGGRLAADNATQVDRQTFETAMSTGQLPGPSGKHRASGLPRGDAPKNNQPGQKRKKLSAEEMEKLHEISTHLKGIAKPDPDSKWGDLLADEKIIRIFQQQYESLTNVKPVYAQDLVQLLRDHGDDLIRMHERAIPIGVTSYSGKKCDEVAIKKFVRSMFNALDEEGLLGDVALVGGFTDLGGIKASMSAADNFPEVEKQGVMAPPGVFHPTAQVDKGLVFGKSSWGEESPVFLDLISNGFMVGIGGGAQARDEASWFIQRNGDNAIIAEGFTHSGKDGTQAPGSLDDLPGGRHLEGAAVDPVKAGYAAGKHIAQKVRERRAEQLESPLLKLAMEASPKQIVDVDQWAKANTSKYRIIRILNAVRDRLENAKVPEASITSQLTELGFRLVENTFGIDNFNENGLWQKRAKEAVTQVGGDVGRLLEQFELDVMFASWFGIQEYKEKPSYFEQNVSDMPTVITDADLQEEHTLDARAYSEIRLDYKTTAYLQAEDAQPEVFLGSRDEMEAFYRAHGFQFSQSLHDSNGSTYYLMTNGYTRRVVIHGVDSEARLMQLSALMKASGADPSRVTVRGTVEKVRHANRNMLELALANLGAPIAGVVIGNKSGAFDAVAQAAGVDPKDLKIENKTVGPFRFQVARVGVAGRDEPQVLVGFSPAYGELSQDVVAAAVSAGARNFMMGGAGGSLIESDELGAVHQVTSADYYAKVVDLEQTPNVHLIAVPNATKVRNVFSPAPLEQTKSWANEARAKGAGDVDQETAPIFLAVQEAAAKGHALNVMACLYQSDVVGTGALNSGTVGNDYSAALTKLAGQFTSALGIAGIETTGGDFATISGAKPGILAEQKPRRANAADIELPLPDLDTIGDSSWLSSTQQFKGQKRVLQVRTDSFGAKERRMLRELLHELNPTQFWVNVGQSDPNHGEILQIAQEAGFESILVATTQAVREEKVAGSPTFIVKEGDDEAVQATLDELVRDGANDDYERNTAQHYLLHLGRAKPTETVKGHIYSSLLDLDDVADLADDIRREARAGIRAARDEIKKHFAAEGAEAPTFHVVEELGDFIGSRKPVMISGASKKSWPQVSPEQQAYIKVMLQALAINLDPKKYVIVTGGTDHGVEKIAHEAFAAAGFDILGTITENTAGDEVSTHVKDLVFTGINWFGMARPAYREIVEAFNGENITAGGGGILRDMIQLALKLNLRVHNLNGPDGASTEAAADYAAHAFGNIRDLFARMGLDPARLPDIEDIGVQAARWWTPEQIGWTMPKSFKAAKDALGEASAREMAALCEQLNRGALPTDRPMEDQIRKALPETIAAIERSDSFAKEFGELVDAMQQARNAHPGDTRSYEERLSTAQHLEELASQLAASKPAGGTAKDKSVHVDDVVDGIAKAVSEGGTASFSPMQLMGAAAQKARK